MRWYSPTLGRWITVDVLRFEAGDMNLYGFVWNDPVNRIDPSGLQPPTDWPLGMMPNSQPPSRAEMLTHTYRHWVPNTNTEDNQNSALTIVSGIGFGGMVTGASLLGLSAPLVPKRTGGFTSLGQVLGHAIVPAEWQKMGYRLSTPTPFLPPNASTSNGVTYANRVVIPRFGFYIFWVSAGFAIGKECFTFKNTFNPKPIPPKNNETKKPEQPGPGIVYVPRVDKTNGNVYKDVYYRDSHGRLTPPPTLPDNPTP